MNTRFDGMKKVSKQPALRLLSLANAKLLTVPKVAASASVPEMLEALEKEGALPDMLRVMSVALPARERVWWSCLCARDLMPEGQAKPPLSLELSEAWVRKPLDDTRAAMRDAIDLADPDDDSVLCATAALFSDDTLGPGDLKQYSAPVGASQTAAFICSINSATAQGDFTARANVLIDRAVDIARGGNGQLALPETPLETDDEDSEEEEMSA